MTPLRNPPSRAQWLRRLALRRKDRIAFALSGGGPLGALQVGALKALFEHGIHPDAVVGTSVGALNATFLAFDPTLAGTAGLERMWRSMREADLFPNGRFRTVWTKMFVRGSHVFGNDGIKRLVHGRVAGARFEDAEIPVAVVATDLESGLEMVFSTGAVLNPLLASTAMPGVFPPVEIEGRLYIDGGVSNNVPIAPALDMGATTVYVMDSTAHNMQRRPLLRPFDYLLHGFALARSQRFEVERRLLAERIKIVVLPTPPIDFHVPFSSMSFTDTLIRLAYEHTSRFLSAPAA